MLEQLLPQLLTAVLTALITLSGVYLANRYQRKTEEDKFNRAKESEIERFKQEQLEELYLLYVKWDGDLASLADLFFQAHIGVSQTEHPFITASKNKLSEVDCFYRIMMIVELRFPEFKPGFNRVLDARSNVMQFCGEVIPKGKSPMDMAQALDDFRDISKEFKEKLIDKALMGV